MSSPKDNSLDDPREKSRGMATKAPKKSARLREDRGLQGKSNKNMFTMRNACRAAKNPALPSKESDVKLRREVENLEKQAKRREAEFSKIKAVLEQKLELKNLQYIDLQETMEGQKEMYNSMLKALQNKSENSTYEEQLEKIKEMQKKQDSELNDVRTKYEKQITDLKERINMQEFNEKSLKSQLKQEKNDHKQELREKNQTINELQLKNQKLTMERDKNMEKLRNKIEKMEEQHAKDLKELKGTNTDDIDGIKEEYESKLRDIKHLNEEEVISLRNQIRLLEEELLLMKEQEQSFEVNRDSEFETDNVKTLDIRLSEINDKFADNMLTSEKEIAKLRRENDEKDSLIENLKLKVEKIKSTMEGRLDEKDQKYSKLKNKLAEKTSELQKAQKKTKDSYSLKKRLTDLKVKVSKLEAIKRDLKDSLKIKENELEAERARSMKAVYEERKKNKEKGEKINRMKKEMDIQSIEIESIKRDGDTSMMSDSRYYSPSGFGKNSKRSARYLSPENTAYSSKKGNFESPRHSRMLSGGIMNESTSDLRNVRRLKSSSPNRSKMNTSTQKIKVGGLSRNLSQRRMIQISTEHVNMYDDTHTHNHGGGKYCEACKWKTWRIKSLKYDPEGLLKNRDLIRYVTCLGCNKSLEVKKFIKHTRDCRLSNQVPLIDGFKYWKKEDYDDSSPEENSDNSHSGTVSKSYKISLKPNSTSKPSTKKRIVSSKLESTQNQKSLPQLLSFEDPSKHSSKKSRINSTQLEDSKQNESSENIEEEQEEKSFTYNLYGSISKGGVTKVEAEKLQKEMLTVRSENKEIMEKMNQMQNSFLEVISKHNGREESLMNEILTLKSKIGDEDTIQLDLESDLRSHLEAGTEDGGDRGSFAKPLEDYSDINADTQTDRRIYRNRRFK